MYKLIIIFSLLSPIRIDNNNLTLDNFESKEQCEHYKDFYKVDLEPFIKGFFHFQMDTEIEITSSTCERDSV